MQGGMYDGDGLLAAGRDLFRVLHDRLGRGLHARIEAGTGRMMQAWWRYWNATDDEAD